MNRIKIIIKNSFLFPAFTYLKSKKQIYKWKKNGKKLPAPNAVKVTIIKKIASDKNINIFIETGTYLGQTIYLTKRFFKKIYSIELDKKLHERAEKLFKKNKNIIIIQGDSGEKVKDVLQNIDNPALFWLDGHFSAGITAKGELNTPIIKELQAILKHHIKNHVILIDDARCFNGENDYPEMNDLRKLSSEQYENFDIETDIIRIYN